MLSRTFLLAVLVFSALRIVNAASSVSIPSDLSSSFEPDAISLQTSYDDQSDNGFADGSTFTTQQTSQAPVFALGDASGVNTEIKFLIMMVDTTDSTKRVLHYLQTDFKATGEKTAIASSTQPKVQYKGPGTLGESGKRDYSFLMYEQKSGFAGAGLPSSGSAFDVKTFQTNNGLGNALAGNIMVVDAQGSSSGGGATSAEPSQAQTQAQQTAAMTTAAIVQTTAAAQNSVTQAQATAQATTVARSSTAVASTSETAQTGITAGATSSANKATRTAVGAVASSTLSTAVGASSAASSTSATAVTGGAIPRPVLGNCGLLLFIAVAAALI